MGLLVVGGGRGDFRVFGGSFADIVIWVFGFSIVRGFLLLKSILWGFLFSGFWEISILFYKCR